MSENFNFRNVNTRLRLLTEGKRLLMVHQGYGNYIFSMNPQQNVIYATKTPKCEYDPNDWVSRHPEQFLLCGYGEWYLEIEKPGIRIVEIEMPGKYERI